MKLLRANGGSPTASPIASPIATDSAKATASSQKVICSAAGTPRVSNTALSDIRTREGGLRNIGSIHQRAAISHSTNSSAMAASRASQGRCSHCLIAAALIASAVPAPRARTRSG